MIITRSPYRVSFFGGGSDYYAWYSNFGGRVLTSTIKKYCYISLRHMPPFLGHKYRVFWSKSEAVDRIEDIEHAGVRGCLQLFGTDEGIEVNHAGDLPARSGLGSSSAFTVGMLHALYALNKISPGRVTLANQAIEVEQKVLKETVGIQDQIECAWGGLNAIDITREGNYSVHPVSLTIHQLQYIQDHLVLVFTDLQRSASQIAKAQVDRMGDNREKMHEIVSLVQPATEALTAGDMQHFGMLLRKAWAFKRELSDYITNPTIDAIYETAIQAGAYGGKLLGAGSGGFMLFCVAPEKRAEVLDAVGLLSVPVEFDHNGSQLILAE